MARLRPAAGEDPTDFIVWRNRYAATMSRKSGPWNSLHLSLCRNWYSHLLRGRNHRSFAAQLVQFRGAEFLDTMRVLMRPRSAARGAGTRSARGYPKPRWEEQVLRNS